MGTIPRAYCLGCSFSHSFAGSICRSRVANCSDSNDWRKYAWKEELYSHIGTADQSSTTGFYPSLAFDFEELDHSAYYNLMQTSLCYVLSPGAGRQFGPIASKGDIGSHPLLAFAPGDYPAVSYHSATIRHSDFATSSITRLTFIPSSNIRRYLKM